MKLFKLSNIEHLVPTDPIFVGEATVQPLVGEGVTFKADMVNFGVGARNKLHTHTSDQILVVTEGKGYIVTDTEKEEILPGDVVFIPAGERHWHGATEDSKMSHIHIVGKGSPCTVVGD
jgi:4-carboxymuconolactone decarboxylase